MPIETKLLDFTPFNEENLEERLIVALLLDTSMSMQGKPLNELINGLRTLEQAMKESAKTRKRVELLLLTFGETVTIVNEFISAEDFQTPPLMAHGGTPMGEAILLALKKIDERKKIYKDNAIDYFRPLMIMITDGQPTDEDVWETAIGELAKNIAEKRVHFQAIGVLDANMQVLMQMNPSNDVILLNKVENFEHFFKHLGNSVEGAVPHEQISQTQDYAEIASVHR